jgi:hypothetical protein
MSTSPKQENSEQMREGVGDVGMLDIIIKTITTAHRHADVAVVTSTPANDVFVFYTPSATRLSVW